MSDNDDLTGIFDHLTPEDFLDIDKSAQRMDLPDGCSFDSFVNEQMNMLRYAFAACDGSINPMTILATDTTIIINQADDDESLGQYVERMSSEARKNKARWAFFYKRTLIAKQELGGDSYVDDTNLMNAALKSGAAWEAMYWYAARIDGVEPHMRHGYVAIDGAKLGKVTEAPLQPNQLLKKILEP